MDNSDDQRPTSEEQEVARLLRVAGRRPALPEDMKSRLEAGFRAELTRVLAARKRRRLIRLSALAAALLVALLVTLQITPDRQPGRPVAQLTHIQGAVTINAKPASSAASLVSGTRLETGSGATLSMTLAGYGVRLKEHSRLLLRDRSLRLEQGAVYIESLSAGKAVRGLKISTPHGSVTDIGTQFIVETNTDATRTTVRLGAILIERDDRQLTLKPTHQAARFAHFGQTGDIAIDSAPARGPDWQWIHSAAAPFVIEGASPYQFLQWAARELGCSLAFDSPEAEARAHLDTLHGNTGAAHLLDNLNAVLMTSGLSAQLTDGSRLQVRLER